MMRAGVQRRRSARSGDRQWRVSEREPEVYGSGLRSVDPIAVVLVGSGRRCVPEPARTERLPKVAVKEIPMFSACKTVQHPA